MAHGKNDSVQTATMKTVLMCNITFKTDYITIVLVRTALLPVFLGERCR